LLLYDFATWRGLLIRDNQLTVGTLVNVIFLGLALCNNETKKNGEKTARFTVAVLAPAFAKQKQEAEDDETRPN
jgi:hypothetical protein